MQQMWRHPREQSLPRLARGRGSFPAFSGRSRYRRSYFLYILQRTHLLKASSASSPRYVFSLIKFTIFILGCFKTISFISLPDIFEGSKHTPYPKFIHLYIDLQISTFLGSLSIITITRSLFFKSLLLSKEVPATATALGKNILSIGPSTAYIVLFSSNFSKPKIFSFFSFVLIV